LKISKLANTNRGENLRKELNKERKAAGQATWKYSPFTKKDFKEGLLLVYVANCAYQPATIADLFEKVCFINTCFSI
jgi:hypothetical protein